MDESQFQNNAEEVLKDFFSHPAVKMAAVIGLALVVDKVFLKSKYREELGDKFIKDVLYGNIGPLDE